MKNHFLYLIAVTFTFNNCSVAKISPKNRDLNRTIIVEEVVQETNVAPLPAPTPPVIETPTYNPKENSTQSTSTQPTTISQPQTYSQPTTPTTSVAPMPTPQPVVVEAPSYEPQNYPQAIVEPEVTPVVKKKKIVKKKRVVKKERVVKKQKTTKKREKIAKKTTPQKVVSNPSVYRVQPGDTLEAISKRFNISVNRLMRYNLLTNHTIKSGQELYLTYTKAAKKQAKRATKLASAKTTSRAKTISKKRKIKRKHTKKRRVRRKRYEEPYNIRKHKYDPELLGPQSTMKDNPLLM